MEQKKGFWARLFGTRKASSCCNVRFEEVTDEPVAPPGQEAEKKDPPAQGACCGGGSAPTMSGNGGRCG